MSFNTERPYVDSFRALGAIHGVLSYAVEAALGDCNYDDAIKYADLMYRIERKGYALLDEMRGSCDE